MKKHVMATNFCGAYFLDKIPKMVDSVPTIEELQKGYGANIPAYDFVSQYVPLDIRVKSGGKGTRNIYYPARRVLGLAAVYWNGAGGPQHFRDPKPHGSMVAKWTRGPPSNAGVYVDEVYQDPKFYKSTRVTSLNIGTVQADGYAPLCDDSTSKMGETVERLIDPDAPTKMSQQHGEGKDWAHNYEGKQDPQNHYATGQAGRWWPVWLVCRTKKGWWTICWYQLLDGAWVVEFWWYDDIHIHLIDWIR